MHGAELHWLRCVDPLYKHFGNATLEWIMNHSFDHTNGVFRLIFIIDFGNGSQRMCRTRFLRCFKSNLKVKSRSLILGWNVSQKRIKNISRNFRKLFQELSINVKILRKFARNLNRNRMMGGFADDKENFYCS